MRIFALSENAVTVEFGSVISLELNQKAMALTQHLDDAPFPGYIESVPAYASATIFYDIQKVRNSYPDHPSAFDAVCTIVETAESLADSAASEKNNRIEIAVKFDETNGPDLISAADMCGLSVDKFIDVFTSLDYRVYMLGFLPGFAYMGEVDESIALPRLSSPRKNVPAGSVGIAGRQTGIYPFDSPGGWQLIGRTDVKVFNPNGERPCLFEPGDIVKFVAV